MYFDWSCGWQCAALIYAGILAFFVGAGTTALVIFLGLRWMVLRPERWIHGLGYLSILGIIVLVGFFYLRFDNSWIYEGTLLLMLVGLGFYFILAVGVGAMVVAIVIVLRWAALRFVEVLRQRWSV